MQCTMTKSGEMPIDESCILIGCHGTNTFINDPGEIIDPHFGLLLIYIREIRAF